MNKADITKPLENLKKESYSAIAEQKASEEKDLECLMPLCLNTSQVDSIGSSTNSNCTELYLEDVKSPSSFKGAAVKYDGANNSVSGKWYQKNKLPPDNNNTPNKKNNTPNKNKTKSLNNSFYAQKHGNLSNRNSTSNNYNNNTNYKSKSKGSASVSNKPQDLRAAKSVIVFNSPKKQGFHSPMLSHFKSNS